MGYVGLILNICIVLSGQVYMAESLSLEMSVHCAQRRAISPCTCQYQQLTNRSTIFISVTCERMISFHQVITALQNKFDTNVDISLKISHSILDDLPQLSFQQLGLSIQQLKLHFDNLSDLPESVFSGLGRTESFSLADNAFTVVPQQALNFMPNIKVLDLSHGHILNVTTADFHGLNFVHTLLINNNNVSLLEMYCLPSTLVKLHIGMNEIKDLNGTLRELTYLQWLYVKWNQLVNLDGELPQANPNTKMLLLDAAYNLITKLPQELKFYRALEVLSMEFNHITTLDRILSRSKQLKVLNFTHNKISILNENDFADLEYLEDLYLGYNNIVTLNNSLLPLISLRILNLSYNQIQEFSLQQLRGLTKLQLVDLSHNKINKLSGRMQNSVQLVTRIDELWLQFNDLQALNGSLMGLTGLRTLNLSHNIIERISPDDLIGLDDLEILDISHNHIITLEETSKAVLPKLEELKASYNLLSHLEKDFHGLPRLCWADLSYNRIESISIALGKYTQCIVHSVHKPLRIYLQGNMEVCRLSDVITNLQAQNNTEFYTPSNEECTANLAKQSQIAVLSSANIA
uniref:Putative leucine-rich repeat and immunoglobulin-like protein 1 n=1 Tax=Panstrongylus lignarius TaxID=156445 RepID=A0A224X9X9_9HEMI